MDIIQIEPIMLQGKVKIPPSKSVAHRAIIAAALSGEPCRVENIALSKDIQATLGCMEAMGADFSVNEKEGVVTFSGKQKRIPKILRLNCEESGSTLRFLTPVALLFGRKVTLSGKGRLMSRPQKPYIDLFATREISCAIKKDTMTLEGKLEPGKFSLPGDVSSQFVTGLLFALPMLDGDSEIVITTEMESKGYLDLTLSVLNDFGIQIINENYRRFLIPGGQKYKGTDYRVEGDYSQAAFFLVAGAIGCKLRCDGLDENSLQGDKKILEILEQTGANVIKHPDGSIGVTPTEAMHGIEIDAREIPDLVPVLAVLCGFLKGESRIVNAGRLRMKESDRLAAISSELSRLGLDIEEGVDYLKIQGTQILCGETVSSWNDHRIAMALAVAACRCEGAVTITGAKEAVKKSFPDFFEVYQGLQQGPKTLMKFGQEITEEEG
ncbi:MAG: 3-phosphoshikimate 1-carboxyvinyltransferase [Clostridia bacterium]|nr:3-phosphoshikimate 1-carboxyvinyltransferase [Clostridia bacterium]